MIGPVGCYPNGHSWPYNACRQTKAAIYFNYILVAPATIVNNNDQNRPATEQPSYINDVESRISVIHVDTFKNNNHKNSKIDWDVISTMIQNGSTRPVPPVLDEILEFANSNSATGCAASINPIWSSRILYLMWNSLSPCVCTLVCWHPHDGKWCQAHFLFRLARTFVNNYMEDEIGKERCIYRWSRFCYWPSYNKGLTFPENCKESHSYLWREIQGRHKYVRNPQNKDGDRTEFLYEFPPGVTPEDDFVPPLTPIVGVGVLRRIMTPLTPSAGLEDMVSNGFYDSPTCLHKTAFATEVVDPDAIAEYINKEVLFPPHPNPSPRFSEAVAKHNYPPYHGWTPDTQPPAPTTPG